MKWHRSGFCLWFSACSLFACDTEDPTTVVVHNDYAVRTAGTVVYRVWWGSTLVDSAVAPDTDSPIERGVPATDYAYALLAPGWDPTSDSAPTKLIPVRSAAPLTIGRGDTLRIAISNASFTGNCEGGQPLAQQDADYITQRIFPGPFAGATYDAATCTRTTIADLTDAGIDSAL